MNPLVRLGSLILGLVLGIGTGLATTLLHTHGWGLLLGVLASAAVLVGASMTPRIGFTIGWLLVVARAALARPEGDFLISADLSGFLLLGWSMVLVLATLVALGATRGRAT